MAKLSRLHQVNKDYYLVISSSLLPNLFLKLLEKRKRKKESEGNGKKEKKRNIILQRTENKLCKMVLDFVYKQVDFLQGKWNEPKFGVLKVAGKRMIVYENGFNLARGCREKSPPPAKNTAMHSYGRGGGQWTGMLLALSLQAASLPTIRQLIQREECKCTSRANVHPNIQ